ncbi:hypothetical protein XaFJ1_GM000461 [Xanthomonas albilineans]|nr:hypothetical protein XaFJ1_GM000461 [Xanthomonas albilineans]
MLAVFASACLTLHLLKWVLAMIFLST